MASYRQQFLSLLSQQETTLAALLAEAAMRIAYTLSQYADVNGDIPPSRQREAEQAIMAILSALFLVMNAREGLSAFTVNTVTRATIPESPFARVLWDTAEKMGRLAVEQQASILRTALRRSPSLIDAYERARVSPFAPNAPLTERERAFFAAYTPPQNVVFGSGRALEDSVIYSALETQRKTRLLLRTLFAEGMSARGIADTVRVFLTPDTTSARRGVFGANGVTHAMQIARSFPVYTHSVVGQAAAVLNPFVTQVWIERSRSTPCPICDPVAAGSPYEVGEIQLGLHANCLCVMRFETTGRPSAVIERLRGDDTERLRVRGALAAGFLEDMLRSQVILTR